MPNSLSVYQEVYLISIFGVPVLSVAKWEQVTFKNLCIAASLKGWNINNEGNKGHFERYKPRTNGDDFDIDFWENSIIKISVRKIIHCSFDLADEQPPTPPQKEIEMPKTFNDWHEDFIHENFAPKEG